MAKRQKSVRFVSRGGDKLEGALQAFGFDVSGLVAVDLGANVGGFTDCLLQRDVSKVYAVDTGYGVLEWKLRQDPRVEVLERTNALHVELPEKVDLAVVDVGWTPMARIVPVALSLVKPGGHVIALLKPQYEAQKDELENGVVRADCLDQVVQRAINELADQGNCVLDQTPSVVAGSGGNQEFLVRFQPT